MRSNRGSFRLPEHNRESFRLPENLNTSPHLKGKGGNHGNESTTSSVVNNKIAPMAEPHVHDQEIRPIPLTGTQPVQVSLA